MAGITIAGKNIGLGEPCFVMAEAGVNHNGDINLAKKLVDVAREAGADAVKFQNFTAEKVVTRNAEKAAYQKKTTGVQESQFDMLKKLELSSGEHAELKKYADGQGILFLSTPYDEQSVDLLCDLGVAAFKISSADITNHPFLEYVAGKKLPVILSTGMSYLGEIEEALEAITRNGNDQVVLLHCNFNYPARVEDINLRAMDTLKRAFGFPVGFSDHTPGIEVSVAAVALGAVMIEKHFTLDRGLPGPDHKASLEPDELKALVTSIRNVERAMGSPIKRPSGEEAQNRAISRRSLVAAKDIAAGTTITKDMVAVKRPGTGILPGYLDAIVGGKARSNIKQDELIKWDMI